MAIEIKSLKVNNNESIWVRIKDNNDYYNIVIDSGNNSTESYTCFYNMINEIKKRKCEKIDFFILTHIDDDHIGGFFKYINSENFDSNIVGEVLFNTEKNINEILKINKDNDYSIRFASNLHTVAKAQSITTNIESKGIKLRKITKFGDVINLHNIKLTILTPTIEILKEYISKIFLVEEHTQHSSEDSRNIDINEININKYNKDNSLTNRSSISFILEFNDKKFAFLGDAEANDICDSIDKIFIDDLKCELVKLPHHGSDRNINIELLKKLNSDKFLLCCKNFKHKTTIAKICRYDDKNKLIYTNYNWFKKNFFSESDMKKYIDIKIILENKDVIYF